MYNVPREKRTGIATQFELSDCFCCFAKSDAHLPRDPLPRTKAQSADCSALLGAQAAAASETTVCVAKIPKTTAHFPPDPLSRTKAQSADCSALLGAQATAASETTVCVAKIPKTTHTDLRACVA